MVVFASGIVDERLPRWVVGLSTACPASVGGCGTWSAGSGGWFWHTVGVLRDHAGAGFFGASFAPCCAVVWWVGVGGCGVWLLNSGREHLGSRVFLGGRKQI